MLMEGIAKYSFLDLELSVPSLHSELCFFYCRIPIIAGKELNLHRLFVEVTSRGGIEKVT
jgi:hypothetical protein